MTGIRGVTPRPNRKTSGSFTFVDLFAGCGGLSLGLLNSGWNGLFTIEKSADAFGTLCHNLVDEGAHNRNKPRFSWPEWLSVEAHEIRGFIDNYRAELGKLKNVDLVAGGLPCQGFSFAGRRAGKDPRNQLFKSHLDVVDLLKPRVVLLENVRGINIAFGAKGAQGERSRQSYADRIRTELSKRGYDVQQRLIKAVDFGVPQIRPRFFIVGILKSLFVPHEPADFFELLYNNIRTKFLEAKDLPGRPVTVAEAISDLETTGKNTVPCSDPESPPGFREIVYSGPRPCSQYQQLMHKGLNGNAPNSLRLVNHRRKTKARFKKILKKCRKGVSLSSADRESLSIKKTAITPLDQNRPSHTLTTIPDDLLHYKEPRVHTVREHARHQSFPDWFEFRGKYTTGAKNRAWECPRYTQVGNAVPPLLAGVIGKALKKLLERAASSSRRSGTRKHVAIRSGR